MLFKLAGCIIVIISCTFLGFMLSFECKKRPQQLRELQVLLQMLENQIGYLSDVLIDAFEKISRNGTSQACIFFNKSAEILKKDGSMGASQAWELSVRQNIRKTSLNREDEEILIAFGKILGSSDIEGQIKNIRLVMEQLKLQEVKAEENRRSYEKMYRSLGVLSGVALVILLI